MKLEIAGLSKQFNDIRAVNSVSFSMGKGVYGLLGANGAGKTTLMRMMCTLLTPSSGTISFDGESILKLGESYREILGYLPQDFGYYPEFSAEDYLLYIASLKGIKRGYAKKRAEELLKKVSLWEVRKKKIKKFSGGMKRRLGIAQAVLNDPKILILDEPTAGLDPKERIRFRNLISSLAEDRIILLSTHIVSDLQSIANRIFIMKTGNIAAEGTSQELIDKVDGYVWRCEATSQQAEEFQDKYIISNLKSEGNKVELRIISEEKPTENAVYEKPTLEDLFMYYFGEAGKDDVSI